jgi:iron(III) transport system permease protein
MLYGSFKDGAPGQAGGFTLAHWRAVLGDAGTFRVLLNSVLIAVPRTMLALLLATVFAWCIARTTTPRKRVLEGLLVFLFFLPELPWVLAWMLLGAPNVSLLNQWLRAIFPGVETFINVYSYAGLIILGAVRSAPVLFLFVYPAFQAMDATLEEAARMAGAGGWRTIWRVNLPLLLPALLGHPFVRGRHGVLRDPAAPRHAGEDLRLHDQDLRTSPTADTSPASAPPWCWRCSFCSSP